MRKEVPCDDGIEARYRVVVLETTDIVDRLDLSKPNVCITLSLIEPEHLAAGLNSGKHRPSWARHRVRCVRYDLMDTGLFSHQAGKAAQERIRRNLQRAGYTVNRDTRTYRTYVIRLNNPKLTDPGRGYVYVGMTSKPVSERLQEHLTDARRENGYRRASRVVARYGVELAPELMNSKVDLEQGQARRAERRLAERLRGEGYVVEGGT